MTKSVMGIMMKFGGAILFFENIQFCKDLILSIWKSSRSPCNYNAMQSSMGLVIHDGDVLY